VFNSLFRVHIVYSADGLLMHAYLDWDEMEDNIWFENNPIGAYKNLQGTRFGWDEGEVMGQWPDAVGLWTDLSESDDDIFAYEEMPAVAYIRGTGLTFRRTEKPIALTSPMYNWFERQHLGSAPDMRPTIDAIRDGGPKVAWAPACPWGGNLLFRESETDNPNHKNEWLPTVLAGSESACDPEMSIGEYERPYVAYANPTTNEIEIAVRPFESLPWENEVVSEGAEPSIDYNKTTEMQAIAYVQPWTGELHVVDGYFH